MAVRAYAPTKKCFGPDNRVYKPGDGRILYIDEDGPLKKFKGGAGWKEISEAINEGIVDTELSKKVQIKSALMRMKTKDDKQWTAQGLPKVDVVANLCGFGVTRQEIELAWPGYNRTSEQVPLSKVKEEIVLPPAG